MLLEIVAKEAGREPVVNSVEISGPPEDVFPRPRSIGVGSHSPSEPEAAAAPGRCVRPGFLSTLATRMRVTALA
jgi:hypothetical protein